MFNRHDLAEMELGELEQALESIGQPRFHGRQLFQWVHKRGVTEFAEMTDLGRDLRSTLAAAFRIVTPEVVRREQSSDGTTKFLLRLEDGQLIESVFIPDTPANTFCLSTQVGCAMKCGFCLTGQDGHHPQSHRRRDRRPGARADARARHAAGSLQHRPHGHGRAAAQLRRGDEGAAHARRRARPGRQSRDA